MSVSRPGAKFIAESLGPDSRLGVVQFSTDQSYVLEYCGDLIRFYRDDQIVAEGKLDRPLVT